ncbi:hypothetical protein Tco_0527073 [Tanacetum coccineum]
MGCGGVIYEMLTIKLCVARTDEEIFTLEAWTKAFNIKVPIYTELCHEFYSTYIFDEVCADDKLRTKKIIKFRLCGHSYNLNLLEFTRSDEHFNAREYWLRISRKEELHLSRSSASTIWNPVLRARHQDGYANVAWLIAKWMKRKGDGSQKESMIYCGQFITKLVRRQLTEEVLRSSSTLIYCRDLDSTTLRELIDSDGRLIPKVLELGVLRVAILRGPRPSMQDCTMECLSIWMLCTMFRWMELTTLYNVLMDGTYNPPGYDQQQDLGFIPSGNVVLSSTYVGKILGADQLLVILCYRYQESGIGYWILSMTISGSGVTFLPSPYQLVHVKFDFLLGMVSRVMRECSRMRDLVVEA